MEALNRLPDNSDNCLARKIPYEPCLSVSLTYTIVRCRTKPLLVPPFVLLVLQRHSLLSSDSGDEGFHRVLHRLVVHLASRFAFFRDPSFNKHRTSTL